MSDYTITRNRSRVRAVLFDCDGVMCLPFEFAKVLDREHGITMEMTSAFFREHFTPALLGRVDVKDLLPPFLDEWGWKLSPAEFLSLWLSSEKEVRPDMKRLVLEVKKRGFVTGLATNQESRRARFMRDEMGFSSLFDHCFISSELVSMKPQSAYFEEVTRRLSLLPEEIAFIDDQQSYLDAAAEAGWRTILFEGSAEKAEEALSCLGTP